MTQKQKSQELRKRMLVMRAEIERAELADCVHDIRSATRIPALLGAALSGGTVSQGLPAMFGLLRKYPAIGTALSLAAARLRGPLMGRVRNVMSHSVTAVGIAKWGSLAFVAWQGWAWWRRYHKVTNKATTRDVV